MRPTGKFSSADLRGVTGENSGVRGSEASRRHADRSGDAVRAGQERQQNIASNTLQSLLENQRQAWYGSP